MTAMQAHRDMTWDKVFAAADMDKPGAWCTEFESSVKLLTTSW